MNEILPGCVSDGVSNTDTIYLEYQYVCATYYVVY